MKEIKVWVGNLGKYNEGELYGEWFTLPHDVSDIMNTIEVADGTPYEEWEIFDWEAPDFVYVDRCSSLEKLNEVAEALDELTEIQVKVLSTLVDEGIIENNIENVLDNIEMVKSGQGYYVLHGYNTLGDIGRDYAIESGFIQDHVFLKCVDFELYAKEIGLESTHFKVDENTWVEWCK